MSPPSRFKIFQLLIIGSSLGRIYFNHLKKPLVDSQPSSVETLNLNKEEVAEQVPDRINDECIRVRGSSGNWYRNETLGRETFYTGMFRANKWARVNLRNKTEVYPGNQFAWNDTSLASNNNETDCQIHPVNINSFCDNMQKLQIRRILFIGDSLMASQLQSLSGLIGYNFFDFIERSRGAIIRKAIDCPDDFSVQIHYRRESLGPNYGKTNITGRQDATLEHRQQFGPETPNCAENTPMGNTSYCPWHLLYNETDEKTLLVLNQGAHFHSMNTFSKSFDLFVELFNSIAHPGDVVVFRSTVPGHLNCWGLDGETGIGPLEITHDKFLERYGTTMYDWNLFDTYNLYAKEKLNDLVPSVTTHYLNVYNMTVLREDEHIRSNDCLHYFCPGPVDFWNHLLFTNLADMSKKQAEA
eukprot:scaffold28330_cov35-Attheya_sp.AAC.2